MANYYELVTDSVLSTQQELQQQADLWGTDTTSRMDALAADTVSKMSILDGTSYAPTYTDNLTYVAPTGTRPAYTTAPDYSALGPEEPELIDLSDTPITAYTNTDTAYVAQLKATMRPVIKNAVNGNVIMPAAVFDAMYDRLTADMAAQYVGEAWAATELGSSLGWDLPSEATLGNLAIVTEKYSESLTTARVEEFVREWMLKHEDIWKGLEASQQFEDLWIREHHDRQTRIIENAKNRVAFAININEEIMARNINNVTFYAEQWKGLSIRIGAETDRFRALIANVGTGIDSERARFPYENKQVDKVHKKEDGEVGLAVETAKLVVENSLGTLSKLAELSANVAMALMAASDVSLGTGTSFGTSESHDYKEKCCT